ncbi:MAG: Gfo/Idh/MocA family protein [Bacilli bacterium]
MGERIRFGIVGCGVIGKKHAQEIAAMEDAELVAVADSAAAAARELGTKHDVKWYGDYRQLLQRDDVDAVNVCVPSGLHAVIAVDAARAGKHVVVEKPIDVSLAAADRMIHAAREAGVKLCVIMQHRFDAATVRVKQEIEAGRLGRMVLGEAAVNWYRSQEYYDSGEWRGTWRLDGGGALMNQSIHTIDLLAHLMGPVKSVFAQTGILDHDRIEVEDVAVATVRFRSGALGTVAATTAAYPGLSARLELFGTRGSAVIDNDRLTHLYHRPGRETHTRYKDKSAVNLAALGAADGVAASADPSLLSDAHLLQFRDMAEAVRTGREPLVNGEEGRKGLEIILAIYESARTGREVDLTREPE